MTPRNKWVFSLSMRQHALHKYAGASMVNRAPHSCGEINPKDMPGPMHVSYWTDPMRNWSHYVGWKPYLHVDNCLDDHFLLIFLWCIFLFMNIYIFFSMRWSWGYVRDYFRGRQGVVARSRIQVRIWGERAAISRRWTTWKAASCCRTSGTRTGTGAHSVLVCRSSSRAATASCSTTGLPSPPCSSSPAERSGRQMNLDLQ